MKVVVDTSILVSSLISKNGDSREIIRVALQNRIAPQIGTKLFLEYEDVVNREEIQKLCPIGKSEIDELFCAV